MSDKLGVELMVDADLVIFSKPDPPPAYWGGDLADLVLVHSGRPLVVPPSFQDGRIGDRIVIA